MHLRPKGTPKGHCEHSQWLLGYITHIIWLIGHGLNAGADLGYHVARVLSEF